MKNQTDIIIQLKRKHKVLSPSKRC